MKNKSHWILISISLAYVVVTSIAVIWFEPAVVNIESDNLLYDSKLVTEGVVPFKELFTRSLVPLYVNAVIFSIFGIHIKLTALFVNAISGAALYVFGRIVLQLFNKQSIAILAVVIMTLFGVRGFPDFFLYFSLWTLLMWRFKPSNWILLVSGASVGLSVLSYSAYITWVIAAMVFIALHYTKQFSSPEISAKRDSLSRILTSQGWFALGSGITLLLPIVYFVQITDWQWMADSFMADSFVYAYILAIVTGVISTCIVHFMKRDITSLAWLTPVVGAIVLTLFFYIGNPGVAVKIGVIHDFFRIASWLLIPFFVVFVFGALRLFTKQLSIIRPVVIVTSAVFVYIAIAGAWHVSRGPSVAFDPEGIVYFCTLMALYIVTLIVYLRSCKNVSFHLEYWQYCVMIIPALITFVASLTYSEWLPTYIYNYAFSLVVAASYLFVYLWNDKERTAKQFLAVCAIGVVCAYALFPKLTKTDQQFNPSTEIQADDAWQVVQYIQAKTTPADSIFTAVPFFALRSGRDMALPITHPVVYTQKLDDPKPYDPYNVIPSVTEIQEYLKTQNIEYIILDERTRSLFATDRHPAIAKFIKKNYDPVQQFGNIKILKKVD